MSHNFNVFLNDAEWAAFKAGQARAHRDQWMNRARDGAGNASLIKVCVNAARNHNREYLRAVAEIRALKAPKRKRA